MEKMEAEHVCNVIYTIIGNIIGDSVSGENLINVVDVGQAFEGLVGYDNFVRPFTNLTEYDKVAYVEA